jgi:hypothetical protein
LRHSVCRFDIETNPSSGCGWADAGTNCNFMQGLVNAALANGINYGTYASAYMWGSIMGGCTVGGRHLARLCRHQTHVHTCTLAHSRAHSLRRRLCVAASVKTVKRPLHSLPAGDHALWYAHYDNNPSFSDFSPFGMYLLKRRDRCVNGGDVPSYFARLSLMWFDNAWCRWLVLSGTTADRSIERTHHARNNTNILLLARSEYMSSAMLLSMC